jgi:nucleoid-associated protein YgaU
MYAGAFDMAQLRYPRRRPGSRSIVRKVAVGVAASGVLLFGLAHVVQGTPASAYETVTVQPGDTLWAIAAKRYPNADVREKIGEIERANQMDDPIIHPGQSLRVPT